MAGGISQGALLPHPGLYTPWQGSCLVAEYVFQGALGPTLDLLLQCWQGGFPGGSWGAVCLTLYYTHPVGGRGVFLRGISFHSLVYTHPGVGFVAGARGQFFKPPPLRCLIFMAIEVGFMRKRVLSKCLAA